MQYLTQINAFYDLLPTKLLSTGQICLWHALMQINNSCGWEEWFSVGNRALEFYTGMSRDGIAAARNTLKQKGLIDFKSASGKAAVYKMLNLCRSEAAEEGRPDKSTGLSAGLHEGTPTVIPSDNTEVMPFSHIKEIRGDERRLEVCTEPEKSVSVPLANLPAIILNDKTEYHVTEADVRMWREAYPAVDVEQQIRAMAAWAGSNPTKRKTRRGVRAFINNWLASEQNKGRRQPKRSSDPFEEIRRREG